MNPANVVPGTFLTDSRRRPFVLLWRCAPLSAGRQPPPDPVNGAKCPFHNYHRDGAMRVDGNNSAATAPPHEPEQLRPPFQSSRIFSEPPLVTEGAATTGIIEDDDYAAPAARRVQPAERRRAPAHVHPHRRRTVAGAEHISAPSGSSCSPQGAPDYGAGVAKALGLK